MSSDATDDRRFSILVDEYKELSAEIRLRIDLQHRNMNVLLVLVTAITGYLVKYASDHGVDRTSGSLVHSQTLVLVVLAPTAINVFLWRHLDHDLNIIDKAAYIGGVLAQQLSESVDGRGVLGFEQFLHHRRKGRPLRAGPFSLFGKEDVPMFFLLVVYLLVGWYVRLDGGARAGDARYIFDGLLYLATCLSAVSFAMAVAIGREYATVGAAKLCAAPGRWR